ncbi:MAG: hypothetical protein Q9169_006329 [Polycauliona sp. 2 TL-2023]
MSKVFNSWLGVLRDTHTTAAYVFTNQACLECAVPRPGISSCQSDLACTALQTRLALVKRIPRLEKKDLLLLGPKPVCEYLQQEDGGTDDAGVFTAVGKFKPNLPYIGSHTHESLEIIDTPQFATTGAEVYFRADKRSFRGKWATKPSSSGSHTPWVSKPSESSNPADPILPSSSKLAQKAKNWGKSIGSK